MRILVAGGTGHTGERLVYRLLSEGHEVRVLSRRSPDDHMLLKRLVDGGAEHTPGDLTKLWSLFEALDGCEMLVSCAHIRFAEGCVSACRQLRVERYLQMSSTRGLSRYTHHPSVLEVRRGEEIIRTSRLDYTIIRPTMIFGGDRDANVEKLVRWFRHRRWFPLIGDGLNLVQPVFVDDLVDLITVAIERDQTARCRTFNAAGPDAMTYREFLTAICEATTAATPWLIRVPAAPARALAALHPNPLYAEIIDRMGENKNVSIKETKQALGFKPRSFREALAIKLGA